MHPQSSIFPQPLQLRRLPAGTSCFTAPRAVGFQPQQVREQSLRSDCLAANTGVFSFLAQLSSMSLVLFVPMKLCIPPMGSYTQSSSHYAGDLFSQTPLPCLPLHSTLSRQPLTAGSDPLLWQPHRLSTNDLCPLFLGQPPGAHSSGVDTYEPQGSYSNLASQTFHSAFYPTWHLVPSWCPPHICLLFRWLFSPATAILLPFFC